MPARPPADALDALLAATNTHDFDNVADLVIDDVLYYFSNATLSGRDAVRAYFKETWDTIREEQYWAGDINWLITTDHAAVATYRYHWRGLIDGRLSSGSGRATNAFTRETDGHWRLAHEHLSTLPS